MKRTVLFGLFVALCFSVSFMLWSCSNEDEDAEVTGDVSGGGGGQGSSFDPNLDDATAFFVGEWSGKGPYVASGTSSSKYGMVNGVWRFNNDGTYSWRGSNTYGYTYSERGGWHYNKEHRLLITDGSCELVWQIVDTLDGQWTGALVAKDGVYTYARTDANVKVGNVRIVDYATGLLEVQDTLFDMEIANQPFRMGICYGTEDNQNPETFLKVYADSVSRATDTYRLMISNLQDEQNYRLRGFVEFTDGKMLFGPECKATCIAPPSRTVFMGGTFYADAALNGNGGLAPVGTPGKLILSDEVHNYRANRFRIMSCDEAMYLIAQDKEVRVEDGGERKICIKDKLNGNELMLPADENWYYSEVYESGKYYMLFYRFDIDGSEVQVETATKFKYSNSVYVLPVYSSSIGKWW